MPTPFISVIIPSYNRPHLIRGAIDSVLAQTFTDYEIIVCDDSDDDETALLIAQKYDDIRIKYIKNTPPLKNGYKNFINAATHHAFGIWITVLPDDDHYCNTDALDRIYNIASKYREIDAIFLDCANDYGFATVFDYDKNIGEIFKKTDLLRYPTIEPVFTFKKALLEDSKFPKTITRPFDNFILIDFLISNYNLGYLQNFGLAFRIANDNFNKHKRYIGEFVRALSFFEDSYSMLNRHFTNSEIERIFIERFGYLKNSATLFSKKYEIVLDTIFNRVLTDVLEARPLVYLDTIATEVQNLYQNEIDDFVGKYDLFKKDNFESNSKKIAGAKKVAIYGSAFMGRQIAKQYKKRGIEVACFIDDFAVDAEIDGVKVIKARDFDLIRDVDYCILASGKINLVQNMRQSLLSLGFEEEKIIAMC